MDASKRGPGDQRGFLLGVFWFKEKEGAFGDDHDPEKGLIAVGFALLRATEHPEVGMVLPSGQRVKLTEMELANHVQVVHK